MKSLIAAMAPTEDTVDNFWQMIYENQVSLIVMLCPDIEHGKVKLFTILMISSRTCLLDTMTQMTSSNQIL